jgi:uncharacterized protein YyaL (SSP411 family)
MGFYSRRALDRHNLRDSIAERLYPAHGTLVEQIGRAVPLMAAALSTHLAGMDQVVVVGETGATDLERVIGLRYRPFTIALTLSEDQQAALSPLVPLIASMKTVGGAAAAYVCRDFACQPPVTNAEELEEALK